jgi:hypothetical protein
MLNAAQSDTETYGISEEDRNRWVRMDDAKLQYGLASLDPVWFHKRGVRIPTGDVVGVLRVSELKRDTEHAKVTMAEAIIEALETSNSASLPMQQCVSVLKTTVTFLSNKTDPDVKRLIEGYFTVPFDISGKTVRAERVLKEGETAATAKSPLVVTLS